MATPTKRISSNAFPSVDTPELGSWNPSSKDGMPPGALYTAKNFRMDVAGQYVIRDGYERSDVLVLDTSPLKAKVYSKAEYFIGGDLFDVTLISQVVSGVLSVYAIFVNITKNKEAVVPSTTPQITLQIATGINSPADDPINVAAVQYESFLAMTIYGKGNFLVYPSYNTGTGLPNQRSTNPSDWVIMPLGKSLANTPTPITSSFAPNTTDDLVVRQSTTENNNEQAFTLIPGQVEPSWLRLPIQAKYWLTTDASLTPPNDLAPMKQWKWDKNDPSDYSDAGPTVGGTDHVQERGWGYIAVFVQEFTNPKGEKVILRSQKSVDWWVPNRYYSPVFLGYEAGHGAIKGDFADIIITTPYPGTQAWTLIGDYPEWGNGRGMSGNAPALVGFPSTADLLNLQLAYRTYWHLEASNDNGKFTGSEDPFKFTAAYLGRLNPADGGGDNYVFNLQTPYVLPISAYDLKQAPMTLFNWSDFSGAAGFPANTKRIEIFRTAYNGVNAQEQTAVQASGSAAPGDPLFQPHLYGYVGAIEKDGTFTDNIKDSEIIFGITPEQYDGYLAGDISGAVIRDFLNKLAIGNVVSKYRVLPPSPSAQQACTFNLKSGSGSILVSDLNVRYLFYYQYVDSEGRVSDLTQITVTPLDNSSSFWNSLVFRVPWGYDPTISKVNVIVQDTSIPAYYLLGSVDVASGYLKVKASDITSTPYTKITVDQVVTKDPPSVAYSEPVDPFFFPFTNIERVHQFAPVTGMDTIIGPLWVWTDRSLTLTTLDNVTPRTEEETKKIGCIGFNAYAKTDKIVCFLSSYGLYYAEGSGVVPFPADVEPLIRSYLQAGDMSNVSIVHHARQQELWVHLPSVGSLPERVVIYKMFGGYPSQSVNYEFEIQDSLNLAIQPITSPVVLYAHHDGSVFSAHFDATTNPSVPVIAIQSNDLTTVAWPGAGYIERRYSLSNTGTRKMFRAAVLRASGRGKLTRANGRPYYTGITPTPGTPDYIGELYNDGTNTVTPVAITDFGTTENVKSIRFAISGPTIDTTAYVPSIRFTSMPDDDGNHTTRLFSLLTYLTVESHP